MVLFSKKISFFLLSVSTLFLLASCGPVESEVVEGEVVEGEVVEGEGGDISSSTSSSEIGDGFTIVDDSAHTHTASVVIGQDNFLSSGDKVSAADSVSAPYGNPTVVDGVLYLPDFSNNRVLGYNSVPVTNDKWANFVVGQSSFLDNLSGSSEFLNEGAQTVTVAGGKLLVTDWGNSRILIYNQRPVGEPAKADVIVGQTGFDLSTTGLANNRLNLPESLFVVDDKLIVADSANNRVLIWNSIPTAHGTTASIVLGQTDFTFNITVNPPTNSSLNFPTAVWSDGSNLVVLDAGNNRILIWNTFPTTSNISADAVIGQKDFSSNSANRGIGTPSNLTLAFSTDGGGLFANGTQLFVADSANHRVLIWDFPLTTNKAASGLIGQNDFDRSGENRNTGITNNNTLSNPTGIYQFYDKLIVTDTGNNRYLIFNSQ